MDEIEYITKINFTSPFASFLMWLIENPSFRTWLTHAAHAAFSWGTTSGDGEGGSSGWWDEGEYLGGVWGGGDQGRKGSSRWSCHKPGKDFLLDFLWKAVLPCQRCNRVTLVHKHLYLTRYSHFADEEIEIRGLKPQNDGTPPWGEHSGIPVWKGCHVCSANDVGVSTSALGSSTTTQA